MLQSSRRQSSNLESLVEAIEVIGTSRLSLCRLVEEIEVIERVGCCLAGKKQAEEEDSQRAEAGAARVPN